MQIVRIEAGEEADLPEMKSLEDFIQPLVVDGDVRATIVLEDEYPLPEGILVNQLVIPKVVVGIDHQLTSDVIREEQRQWK